ncbi:MAG: hypothetical protein ACRDJC_20820 [Thermomicrobiales bacterium]
MMFADTNIFIRAMTGDDPSRARACTGLLRQVDRAEVEIVTCEAVITEILSYDRHFDRIHGVQRVEP